VVNRIAFMNGNDLDLDEFCSTLTIFWRHTQGTDAQMAAGLLHAPRKRTQLLFLGTLALASPEI
jgi:hypothetical protein